MVLYNEVDLSTFCFGPLSVNTNGGKIVYINAAAAEGSKSKNVCVQMCKKDFSDKQCAPFGVSTPQLSDTTGSNKRTLDLTVNEEQRSFVEKLEDKVLEVASERSLEWFGKELTKDQVSSMYTSLLQPPSKEGQSYRVRTKVKLPIEEEGDAKRRKMTPTKIAIVKNEAEHIEYEEGSVNEVSKHSMIAARVELTSVYFISKKQFGISLNVVEMYVWPIEDEKKEGFESDVKLVCIAK